METLAAAGNHKYNAEYMPYGRESKKSPVKLAVRPKKANLGKSSDQSPSTKKRDV
jgi:hypothetical protein